MRFILDPEMRVWDLRPDSGGFRAHSGELGVELVIKHDSDQREPSSEA